MWTPGISSNMNFPAPIAVLGFLAGCGGLVLASLAIVTSWFIKKPRLASVLARVVLVGAILYGGLLLGFSFMSDETTLVRGQEKYFCEIDCHLAYSVVDVKAKAESDSMRYLITLQTRFDETTISARRPKDMPLTPNPRRLRIADDRGREYELAAVGGTPLPTGLIPGQSYTTELQFDVPKDARSLRLLITSRGWPEHLLIGDEQSPLHGKTWLAL